MNSLQLVKFPSGSTCLMNGSEWVQESKFGIVFLNAGIVNMAGPNRLYAKLSERLKHEGFPSFRFDFSGVGGNKEESDEYTFEDYQVNETEFMLEEIKQQFGLRKFILLGLCSGGDVAFRMASNNNSLVLGTILINAYLLPREDIKQINEKAKRSLEKRLYKQKLFDLSQWPSLLRKNPTQLFHVLQRIFRVKSEKKQHTSGNIHRSQSLFPMAKTHPMLLIYSEGSVSYEVFKMKFAADYKKMVEHGANNPNMMYFANTDHNFATVISQLKLFDAVVTWLNEITLVSQPQTEKPAIKNHYH